MNFNSLQWFNPIVLIWVSFSLFLNVIVAYLWHKKFYLKLGLKSYKATQRIHLNEMPRLGGFVFLISLTGHLICSDASESMAILKLIVFSLVPVIVIGLKEDLFHNVSPLIRLLSLFLVSLLFIENFTGPLPKVTDIPFLEKLLLIKGSVSFFYILCLLTIANGMNLIDGVNGLCGATTLSILCALLFISIKSSDFVMAQIISSVIILILPFMIVNYPFGRIFLGDLGAYSLGLIISILTIILFGRHPEILPWAAVLILIYPATEAIFTFLRRMIFRVSVFKPDIHHLHLKIFNFLRSELRFKKVANSFVTPILTCLWLYSALTIPWIYNKPLFIFAGIVFFIIMYLIIYLTVNALQKNSKYSK